MNSHMSRWADFGKFIRDVGFPVVVALILLFQLVPAINKLDKTLIRVVGQQEQIVRILERIEFQRR